ncbi:hypothetical protein, partial [Bacteroides acidifaciens]|uniref:hypothetical protein n=1 Tax=Bacteroides acidifaciens TaxID=85831 RepID=UPI0025A9DE2A
TNGGQTAIIPQVGHHSLFQDSTFVQNPFIYVQNRSPTLFYIPFFPTFVAKSILPNSNQE